MARHRTALERLRELCLALPEAEERETWGNATFRVRDRIFAMHHPTDGIAAMWCKAPSGAQAILIAADPDRFFAPPYVGPKGWIGMRLGAGTDWNEVAGLLRRSYRMTAPKRLTLLAGDEPA